MTESSEPIVVEQVFDASKGTVWRAITDREQMVRWFFENIPAFKAEAGFETQFNVESGERDFLHMWRVTEVVPLKRIQYDWKYDGYPGDSFVVFELSEQGDKTTLRLAHQARESFPEDIPEFRSENCLAGWTYFIRERLAEFMDRRR